MREYEAARKAQRDRQVMTIAFRARQMVELWIFSVSIPELVKMHVGVVRVLRDSAAASAPSKQITASASRVPPRSRRRRRRR